MGPRSFERGNLRGLRESLLPGRGSLQWGRAHSSAEIPPPGSSLCRANPSLQWGRAHSSAEMPLTIQTPMSQSCFNGAALIRARKSDALPQSGTKTQSAASMGPRSFERGNRPRSRPGASRTSSLQWGRAHSSAEIPRSSTAITCRSLLQWGRAHSSAEIALNSGQISSIVSGFNGAALIRARK